MLQKMSDMRAIQTPPHTYWTHCPQCVEATHDERKINKYVQKTMKRSDLAIIQTDGLNGSSFEVVDWCWGQVASR